MISNSRRAVAAMAMVAAMALTGSGIASAHPTTMSLTQTAPAQSSASDESVWVVHTGTVAAVKSKTLAPRFLEPGTSTSTVNRANVKAMSQGPSNTGTSIWDASNCPLVGSVQAFSRLAVCSGQLGWSFDHYKRQGTVLTLTGSISGTLINSAELQVGQTNWIHTLRIQPLLAWGDASSGNYVSAQGTCTRNCTEVWSTSQVPLTLNVWATLTTGLSSSIMATGTMLKMQYEMDEIFDNVGPNEGSAVSQGSLFPEIRCDNGIAWGRSAGCVFDQAWSANVYSRSSPAHGAVAVHVGEAQASLLHNPGRVNAFRVPTGIPLHRTQNAAVLDSNTREKDKECLTLVEGGNSVQPLAAAAPAYQCDEYPYRSTREGAGSGGQYSVKFVPTSQNLSAGGSLGAMFRAARVIDGDAFYTQVTN